VSAFGRYQREAAGRPTEGDLMTTPPIHVYMQRITPRAWPIESELNWWRAGQHKSAYIGWFFGDVGLTRHDGAGVKENENGDIESRPDETYAADLNVNEVRKLRAKASTNSNMPIRMGKGVSPWAV